MARDAFVRPLTGLPRFAGIECPCRKDGCLMKAKIVFPARGVPGYRHDIHHGHRGARRGAPPPSGGTDEGGMIRIGIDIGGTFTDFAVWRDSAQGYTNITSFKVPSTPPTFADAVRTGLDEIIETEGIAPDEEILLVHGTTVSTNAVIERSGPPMALFVTKGFGDLLNIQRLRLDKPIDMFNRRTTPLVAREHVFEIDERLLSDGAVERALPADEVAAAAARASAAGAEALAICFLHSYRNPAHEIAAREVVATRGNGLAMTLSSEIWPQQNEYERAVVAVLNGYVKKIIADYIGEIETYLSVWPEKS